jgi:hypothetical protein
MTTEVIFTDTAKPVRRGTFELCLSIAAAAYVALFLYFVAASTVSAPVYDFLTWVQFYFDSAKAGDWLAYLWTPHNEHRLVWSRLLVAADIWMFGGNNLPFTIFGLLLTCGMVSALAWQILKSSHGREAKTVAALMLVLLLMPSQLAILTGMPAMEVFLQACAFVTFAISLQDYSGGRFTNLKMLLAAVCAVLASFGGSGGLLVWPVVAYSALRNGSYRWAAVIGGAGVIYFAVYVNGLPPHDSTVGVSRVVLSADYVFRFLGLPWSHSSALVWFGRAAGLAVLCGGAFLLVRDFFAGRSANKLERLGLDLILYAFLIAAAAAFARWDVASEREMPIRYAVFGALAHAGILLVTIPALQRALDGARRSIVQALIGTATATLLLQQIVVGIASAHEAGRYNQAWAAFVLGAWSSDMEHYVYPDHATALAGLKTLQQHHVYGQ